MEAMKGRKDGKALKFEFASFIEHVLHILPQ